MVRGRESFPMTGLMSSVTSNRSDLKIYAISMIRNEGDIILATLNHAAELFDRYLIVDVQSTDGTAETIKAFSEIWPNVSLYSFGIQEKYQSAMMNVLAAEAAAEGADWIFFLDGDEFLNTGGRQALQDYLRAFPHEIMHMPWINLVPSEYGDFGTFDISQEFFWSGRVQPYNKVAVAGTYFANYPSFHIHEGNHWISRDLRQHDIDWSVNLGLTVLHVPVRSAERLRYKISHALRTLNSKHNHQEGEGTHVRKLFELISDGRANSDGLNVIAANYGVHDNETESLDVRALGWPSKRLPDYCRKLIPASVTRRTLAETVRADSALRWDKPDFVKGSLVQGKLDSGVIRIKPQPLMGRERLFRGQFKSLNTDHGDPVSDLDVACFLDAASASFLEPTVLVPSAWCELIPALLALFAICRPRRFVELGVQHGMGFFAACDASERLATHTQCVAVDSWLKSAASGQAASEVFEQFRAELTKHFPTQIFIQARFKDAAACFDEASIDLLDIDGSHSYAAVRQDFETWLPRMSPRGVVVLHNINSQEDGAGVWRLWEELQAAYPSFSLLHSGGLGVVYVGSQTNRISALFALLKKDRAYVSVAREYLKSLGKLSSQAASARDQFFERENQLTRIILRMWQEKTAPEHRSADTDSPDHREAYDTIKGSGLFDEAYYLSTYPDVREAGVDPLRHFLQHGTREFRNPSPSFVTAKYLLDHPEALFARVNPLVHYIASRDDAAKR